LLLEYERLPLTAEDEAVEIVIITIMHSTYLIAVAGKPIFQETKGLNPSMIYRLKLLYSPVSLQLINKYNREKRKREGEVDDSKSIKKSSEWSFID